jgi:hypothetical protein
LIQEVIKKGGIRQLLELDLLLIKPFKKK